MDSIFLLQGEARASFLRTIGRAHGCTYICLWSYITSPNNCLASMDGWYNVDNDQPSSSSGSLPQSLFNTYRQSLYRIENGRVPGFAFKQGMPCLQLHELDLLTWASTENQRRFYQEARIKIAMFMGCKSGEIELGLSVLNNTNMQMDQIRNLFTGDFIQQYLSSESGPLDQSQPSLSMPLSLSPFLDMPGTTPYMPDTFKEASSYQVTEPTPLVIPPHQLAMQAHAQSHNIRLPTPASDDAAMTRAMLAVLSSRSSFSSSYGTQQTQTFQHQISDGTGAFKPYDPALDLMTGTSRPNSHGQYTMKLVFAILRSIYSTSQEPWMQETQRKSSQMHHIVTERRRREKISEGFQELISLLPRVRKKDRISVLSNTREYLSALNAQLAELKDKNRMLESQVFPAKEDHDSDTQTERVVIQAVGASSEPLSSEERQIELRVRVREEDSDVVVLVCRILECLKQMKDISIVSLEADTQLHHTNRWNRVILRLKIKTSAWNEESFKAAVNQAVADVAR